MSRTAYRGPCRLPTVLLRHRLRRGSHLDWLLADPAAPGGAIWTGRLRPHSRQWATMRGWYVEQISPHRRHYLTYEGVVGGGRGSVMRVDEGTFTTHQWQHDRIAINLQMVHCRAHILLRRVRSDRWWAKVVAAPAADLDGASYD